MNEYILHWIGGRNETVRGNDIADACNRAGIGRGALQALDYYEPATNQGAQSMPIDPQTFEFTVILVGEEVLTEAQANAIFAAGCDDCTPCSRDGVVYLDFAREAPSYDLAVQGALANLATAGFETTQVQSPVMRFQAEFEAWEGRVRNPVPNPRGGRGCGTGAIGAMMRSIKLLWNQMDEPLKARVREYFDVREVEGEVLVNL
jgi:hypothetical protein